MTRTKTDIEVLKERLRAQALRTAEASKLLADDKGRRNRADGELTASYDGVPADRTLEWQAAEALTLLQHQAQIARRVAIEEAAKVCESTAINAQRRSNDAPGSLGMALLQERSDTAGNLAAAIRALPSALDIDAIVEKAAEALWEAYRTDAGSPNALPLKWAEMPEDLRRVPRLQARAVLAALGIR